MFDIGWTELLVIGVVALIVVGPKDLPVMFRTLGQLTGKARAMAREFSRAMESAADEAGVRDIQKDLRKMANPRKMGMDALNDATRDLADWDPDARPRSRPDAGKPQPLVEPGAVGAAEPDLPEPRPAEAFAPGGTASPKRPDDTPA